jgi:hypothetical protein
LVLKESIALAHYVKKRQFFSEVAP